jgi:small-conductance mechanosensitive channel
MSDRVRTAIITGAAGLTAVLVVRLAMRLALRGYLARLGTRRDAGDIAGQRTRFMILQRLVIAILLAIVAWSVLQVFPSTNALARSLLASGAVLTIFIGIALTGPLSNVGAGILLGLSQSVRLGDRITIGDVTGRATEITLMHTVLVTDDGLRVFIPNAQLASSVVTNRSIDDPRRIVTVRLPLRLGASVDEARRAVLAAVEGFEHGTDESTKVVVADVTETTTWLSLGVHLPPHSDVAPVAAELRELALAALAREKLLPDASQAPGIG